MVEEDGVGLFRTRRPLTVMSPGVARACADQKDLIHRASRRARAPGGQKVRAERFA